jgi:hypothetical protein
MRTRAGLNKAKRSHERKRVLPSPAQNKSLIVSHSSQAFLLKIKKAKVHFSVYFYHPMSNKAIFLYIYKNIRRAVSFRLQIKGLANLQETLINRSIPAQPCNRLAWMEQTTQPSSDKFLTTVEKLMQVGIRLQTDVENLTQTGDNVFLNYF